jgi:malate permease and related proteins
MEPVIDLLKSIFPYLLCIPIGYWIEKKSLFPKSFITGPLIYIMMPILVIYHILEADNTKLLTLPVFSFLLSLAMVLPAKLSHKTFATEYDVHLLKSSFSFFNVAFFGIPIVTALYGNDGLTILICIYIGSALYGDVVGYFLMARSKYSVNESIKKIFQVPFIYAFAIGLLIKWVDVELPQFVEPATDIIGILVSAGGMAIIGSNLTNLNFKDIDWKFVKKAVSFRQISAMAFMAVLLSAEYFIFQFLEVEEREILALIALFPVAANVTVFASLFGSEETNSAILVLVTLVLSLVLVSVSALFLG